MSEFKLRGIAEGVVGLSSVMANNIKDVYTKFPELKEIERKLSVNGGMIEGFSPCDG